MTARVLRCDVPSMRRPSGYHALRQGRVSLPGQLYLLTTVAAYRRPLFRDAELARTICRCLHGPRCWGDATLLCWVLMPDHWHGLVKLGPHDDLALVMSRFKSLTAKSVRCTRSTLVWAPGYHDRALRCDENMRAAARYIVGNPLRAGLVANVLDYPYWDCCWI
jgi:REP element-mobilizing transposase RayT